MDPRISVAIDRSFGPLFYRFHRWAYLASDGRVMTKAMGLPMVVLGTTGCRTGEARNAALLAFPVNETRYVVVPSNGGRDRAPYWLSNLDAQPKVRLKVGRTTYDGLARRATPEEKAEYFPQMYEKYKGWAHYETLTERQIPIVLVDLLLD